MWLDAIRTGSHTRFINRNCKLNTAFYEARCGINHRVVYIENLRPIISGEEYTIDYGDEWFNKPDQHDPPPDEDVEMDDADQSDDNEEDDRMDGDDNLDEGYISSGCRVRGMVSTKRS
jgi:SET domain-containing protein